jgi:uncharacterized membrane protein
MLQRIQSVFLFLVVVFGVLALLFPIAEFTGDMNMLRFYLYSVEDLSPAPFGDAAFTYGRWFTLPLALGQFFIILLAFITLFQYKRRIFQIRLNLLNILLNVLLIGGIFYYASMLETASGATADYKIATLFPLLSVVMIFLANHYIRKDEKLIRSANRLR